MLAFESIVHLKTVKFKFRSSVKLGGRAEKGTKTKFKVTFFRMRNFFLNLPLKLAFTFESIEKCHGLQNIFIYILALINTSHTG